jgi:capsular exopolysaccharide synthesis family protein
VRSSLEELSPGCEEELALELKIVRDPCRELVKHKSRLFGTEGGTIGRSPDSFWVLPDPKLYLSAHHCDVEFIDGEYWLRDSSRNGVFLNGANKPVAHGQRVPLRSGDRLRMGEYELAVKLHEHLDEPGGGLKAANDADALAGHTIAFAALPDAAVVPPSEPPPVEAERTDSAAALVGSAINRITQTGPERDSDGMNRYRPRTLDALADTVTDGKPRTFVPATLDEATMERNCILLGISDQATLRGYKILRTRLRRRLVGNQWRSIGITGEGQGVGKTVTAINVAITFAQDVRTPTFLVDLDLYRPSIGAYLGMKFSKGLSDYLLGEAEIEEIIYSPPVPGLAIVPNSRPLQNASELLASSRMVELIRYLESQGPPHVVLYDMPPLLMSDDVLVFAPHMDCLLDVVAVGVTPRASLERSKELLSEMNVIGVVLNHAAQTDRPEQYYYY